MNADCRDLAAGHPVKTLISGAEAVVGPCVVLKSWFRQTDRRPQ
jgi:hypothetical protein